MPTDRNRDHAGPAAAPIDFTYRYEPAQPKPIFVPASWAEAELFLWTGNHMIASFY